MSALAIAVTNHDVAATRALLKHGANAKTRDSEIGDSVLTLFIGPMRRVALPPDDRQIVMLLLNNGVDVNARNDFGDTSLLQIAKIGDDWTAKQFLLHGARINDADKQGVTPLMKAAANGQVAVVKRFLSAGANPRLKDKKGRTAWNWLREPINIESFYAGGVSDLKQQKREDEGRFGQIARGRAQIKTLLKELQTKPIALRQK